jgi:hypothetical protein
MKLSKLFVLLIVVLTSSCEVPDYMQKVNLGEQESKDNPEDKNEGLSDEQWQRSMRYLSDVNRTFPTSSDITAHIDTFVSPQDYCNRMFGENGSVTNPSSKGARLLLASYYQSCRAIKNVITNRANTLRGVSSKKVSDGKCGLKSRRVRSIHNMDAFLDSHIVFKDLKDNPNYPGDGCIDKRKAPPVYGYCSAGSVSKGYAKLSTKGAGVSSGSLPASGVDCSAFISMALGSQGLKISKDDTSYKRYTTTGMAGVSRSSNSCLKSPGFSDEKSIIPGDIINYRANHVVMIDAVGEDPLGIKKHATSNTCDSIVVDDFDFTYIHSGLTGGNYGPSRVHIRAHRGQSLSMFNNMVQLARKSCKRQVEGRKDLGSASKIHSSNSRFGLFRHQSDDPRCRSEKKLKIEGQGCVEQCVEQG